MDPNDLPVPFLFVGGLAWKGLTIFMVLHFAMFATGVIKIWCKY